MGRANPNASIAQKHSPELTADARAMAITPAVSPDDQPSPSVPTAAVPGDLSSVYSAAGRQYNVDPLLLRAIAQVESGGNPNATGQHTQYGTPSGLMQIIPSTAKALGVTNPDDPTQAIYGAAELLAQNLDRYGNVQDAVKAYYGGTNPNNWGPKTEAYLPKVAAAYTALEKQSGPGSSFNPQDLSDDRLISMLTAGADAPAARTSNAAPSAALQSAAQSSASTAPQNLSNDQLIALLTEGANQSAQPAGAPAASTRQAPQGLWDKAVAADQAVGAGMIQGARQVVNSLTPIAAPIANWLYQNLGPVTAFGSSQKLIPETAAQANAASQAEQAAYNKQYGNSLLATGGRIFGNIAASVPALAAGGEIAAPIIEGAETLPVVGNVAEGLNAPTTTLSRILAGGVKGAAQGAGGAALLSSTSKAPIGQQIEQGAEFGGVLGSLFPSLGAAYKGATNLLVDPAINPARAELARAAVHDYGIPLRWSQITASPWAKFLDSNVGKMPLSGIGHQNDAQVAAFTRAVSNAFGEDSPTLTPQIMSQAKDRIGNVFNDVAARTTINNTPEMMNQIGQVIGQAQQALPDSEVAPLLKQLDNIGSLVDPETHTLSGAAYQALTRKGAPLDRLINGSKDPNVGFYAGKIRDVLDRALQSSADPADTEALQDARAQYKALKTVEPLTTKAGAEGQISPAALLQAVRSSYGDMAYSGAGPLGQLANVGQEFLKEPPSSGTGERLALYYLLAHGGKAVGAFGLGALGGAVSGEPLTTLGTLGGVLATGRAVGAALRNEAIRNRLIDAATEGAPDIFARGVANTGNKLLGQVAIPAAVIARQNLMALPEQGQPVSQIIAR